MASSQGISLQQLATAQRELESHLRVLQQLHSQLPMSIQEGAIRQRVAFVVEKLLRHPHFMGVPSSYAKVLQPAACLRSFANIYY